MCRNVNRHKDIPMKIYTIKVQCTRENIRMTVVRQEILLHIQRWNFYCAEDVLIYIQNFPSNNVFFISLRFLGPEAHRRCS